MVTPFVARHARSKRASSAFFAAASTAGRCFSMRAFHDANGSFSVGGAYDVFPRPP